MNEDAKSVEWVKLADVEKLIDKYAPKMSEDYDVFFDFENEVFSLPTVDEVIRKEPIGHWIQVAEKCGKCSNCGATSTTNGADKTGNANILYARYQYCPHCGAEMKKVK